MNGKWTGLLIGVATVVLVLGGVAAGYFGPAYLHRISQSTVVGDARLDPAPLWPPPRTQFRDVSSRCNFCKHGAPQDVAANKQVQLGWLVSDDSLTGLLNSNVPNQPHTAADAPLPRVVWLVQWKTACWRTPPPGVSTCTAYDIIDDATGWELDSGQAWN